MLAIPLLVPISAVKQHRAISSTVVGDQTETNGVVVFLPHYLFISNCETQKPEHRGMNLPWVLQSFGCGKKLPSLTFKLPFAFLSWTRGLRNCLHTMRNIIKAEWPHLQKPYSFYKSQDRSCPWHLAPPAALRQIGTACRLLIGVGVANDGPWASVSVFTMM